MSNETRPKGEQDTEIPLYIKKDLQLFTSLLGDRKSLRAIIFEKLSQTQNPFAYTLDLVCYGSDLKRNRLSPLTLAILNNFEQWIRQNKVASGFLTLNTKKYALEMVLRQKNCSLIQPIVNAFEMKEDKASLKETLDKYLALGRRKQVCYAVAALGMQQYYTLDEIVYPLLLEDKMNLVNLYLNDQKDLQLEFAMHLDAISSCNEKTTQFINAVMPSVRVRKDCKWMQKMLANFIKHCNIPIERCPNLIKSRGFGALNYLFRKRFIEGTMNNESWKEMVLATVVDIPSLKKEVLVKLVSLNEPELALEMADLLQISVEHWPPALIHFLQTSPIKEPGTNSKETNPSELWDEEMEPNYLTLRLSESDIVLVDNLEKFLDALEIMSSSYDVVGVDAEWRPSMGLTKEVISLLQVATWDNVYLFDIRTLLNCLSVEHWDLLMQKLFSNPNILKLGYGLRADLALMQNIVKGSKVKHVFAQILDFATFFPHLMKVHPDIVEILTDNSVEKFDSSDTDNKGLGRLCQIVLGKPLNKIEQFSDWDRRPLRPAQVSYAALDAFCLLQMYEKLYHTLKNMNSDLQTAVNNFLTAKPPVPKAKDTPGVERTKSPEGPLLEYPPTPIAQFKILVDNCLAGLGKQLRIRGADVLIMPDNENVLQLLRLAKKEGDRIVITRGVRYEKARGELPRGMCFAIPSDYVTTADQIALICRHFNLICSEEDIFSRCTICNCDQYLNITSDQMQLLLDKRKSFPTQVDLQKIIIVPFIKCDNGFVTEEGVMHSRVEVQMYGLTPEIISRIPLFFVCTGCGKVYWEGSHHRRAKSTVATSIKNSETFDMPQCSKKDVQSTNEASLQGTSQQTDSGSLKAQIAVQPVGYDDVSSDEDYGFDDIVYH